MAKEKDFTTIGVRIKAYRLEKELSQEMLGKLAYTSRESISAIERGVKIPRADTLAFIADVLEVSADDLLKDVLEYPSSYNSIMEKDLTPAAKKMLRRILQFLEDLFSEFEI